MIGDVDAETATRLVTAAADVALIVDRKGIIRDVALEDDDLQHESFNAWVGTAWIDTVTVESRSKIQDLMKSRPPSAGTSWRQVNHPTKEGPDLPIRYMTVPIGGDGRLVAVGRNLRAIAKLQQRLIEAQREAEREAAELRGAEIRYRALFQVSDEAILVVDASTMKVTDANPAALARLSNGARRVVNRALVDLFSQESAGDVKGLVALARAAVKPDKVTVRLAGTGREVQLTLSLVRHHDSATFLARLAEPGSALAGSATEYGSAEKSVLVAVERLPDGFVLVDKQRRVLVANTAFLQLVQLGTDEQVRGQPVDRWLGRVDIDMDILLSNLREHGSVRGFGTIVRGEYGLSQDVVISGVAVNGAQSPTCFGITLRRVERSTAPAGGNSSINRSVEQLTALIGRTPLKDIVRETTDLIEKLCIEAALKLTNDNRASAAEVLGLSRQSLYIKLRRYGLGELDGPA